MRRRPEALDGAFDLLVVGGGIYGAWTAYDAALRGLRVALVEREDWGSGTSQSSTKLIHGGLRYLERLEIGLVRRTLGERRRLLALGPHRVRPLRFVVPVYRHARIGRLRLALGLGLYDLIAGARPRVPRHRPLSRRAVVRGWPFLEADGLRGGFAYHDAVTDDARLVLEIVDGALAAGAICVNHAEASLLEEDGRIVGARVTDGPTGRVHTVRASVTVNAAGPWAAHLAGMPAGATATCRLVKGVHLVLPPLPTAEALLLTARSDGRVFFAIPWYGNTLLGTTESDVSGDPSDAGVDEAAIDYLLDEANRALAGLRWTRADLRGAFAGVRALRADGSARATDTSREWTLERPAPGLLMPVGGKLTSARVEAARIVDAVMQTLGRAAGGRPTADRPLPWCPEGRFDDWLRSTVAAGRALGLDQATAHHLALRHGRRAPAVHERLRADRALAERLAPTAPFCRAEVIHAAHSEMALGLDDILRRRLPVAILARPDRAWAADAAALAGDALGWDDARRETECATLLERHALRHRA